MALILEFRNASGSLTRHHVTSLPLTIGRALSNDVVLDDPYADAHHARLRADEAGGLHLDDLGSTNGVRLGDARTGTIAVAAGSQLRIGRTSVRFRDPDEAVAAALVDEPPVAPFVLVPASPVSTPGWIEHRERWLEPLVATTRGRFGVIGLVLLLMGLGTWLGETGRDIGSSVMAAVLLIAMMMLVWSAIWAVAARGGERRGSVFGHVAVLSIALVVVLVANELNEWLSFLFPASSVAPFLFGLVLLAVFAALVAGHLAVANVSTRRKRWRAGWIVSASLLALVMLIGLLANEKSTDAPKYPHELKPAPADLIPARGINAFADSFAGLKKEVDALAEKDSSGGNP